MFKHYTVDDFQQYPDLLNKKFNLADLDTLIKSLNADLKLAHDGDVGVTRDSYVTNISHKTICIHGKPVDYSKGKRSYNSIKNWIYSDGFPVEVNLEQLRLEYPDFTMMGDYQLAQFIYAVKFPNEKVNLRYNFDTTEDIPKLFLAGFARCGCLNDFQRPLVTVDKLQYLINMGRRYTLASSTEQSTNV